MEYHHKSPYQKKTKFEDMHPPSISTSSSSLLGPYFSTCPTKKYSTYHWYDYKSSYGQLSDKVLYRMFAEYYRLQNEDNKQSQSFKHIETCLLTNQIKKNPFKKQHLLQVREKRFLAESFNNPLWTQQATNKSNFVLRDPNKHNVSQTVKQYNQIKKKIGSLFQQKSDKLISANSIFNKNSSRTPIPQPQPPQPQPQDQLKIISKKQDFVLLESKSQTKQQNLTLYNEQSVERNNQAHQEIPKEINLGGRTYFYVKLSNN